MTAVARTPLRPGPRRFGLRRFGLTPTPRSAAVGVAAVVVVLALALAGLAVGDYTLGFDQVVSALTTGQGGFAATIVLQWRLPRVVAALLLGGALGLSGALFQSLTRNPLGSPDVIGFTTGSYTGALVVMLVAGDGVVSTAGGALVGGIASALIVYLLAYRGGVAGFRLIVVGIGVTAMLGSVNQWLLLRADTEAALAASIWGAGSLSLVGWPALVPVAVAAVVLVPAVAALAPALRQLELGDDAAAAHGVRVERDRLLLLVAGVALVALATAAAGPIAFVALAAPQIAKRLQGRAGVPLAGSALTGAGLLLAADLIAQHGLPTALPVGAVTVVLGGAYLVGLLTAGAVRRAR